MNTSLNRSHQLIAVVILVASIACGEENVITTNVPASIKIPTPPITIYLTDKGEGFWGGGPGRISMRTGDFLDALQSSESWAAEQDPEGHWSPVVGGFQVSLRFGQTTFTNGQAIKATVLLRNVSDRPHAFPEIRYAGIPSYGGLGENFEFVVIGPDEKQIEGKERKGVMMVTGGNFRLISNGTQRKFQLPITDEYKFESVGKYRIQVKTLVNDFAGGNKLIPVTSGEAVIEVVK